MIELRWQVTGDRLPADHNYRLYSALVSQAPRLKEIAWQLGTIEGIPDRNGWIKLSDRSVLIIRCGLQDFGLFEALDQQVLQVGTTLVRLGELQGHSLQPFPALRSRIVTIHSNYQEHVEPFEFGVSLGRQLAEKGIRAKPILGERKALRIKDRSIVGYSLLFKELSEQESLTLQIEGLGGRRRMGCGVFLWINQSI